MPEAKVAAALRVLRSAIPVFRVVNVAASMEWYRDVLGFAADPFGGSADPSFAMLCRDSVEIALQKVRADVGEPRSATSAGGGWDAYLRIHEVRQFWLSVRMKVPDVGPIKTTEYGCQEFVVTDPDGHVIVLGECS
jgi:uncharacterized glyoxalase superfamily protein PhnB